MSTRQNIDPPGNDARGADRDAVKGRLSAFAESLAATARGAQDRFPGLGAEQLVSFALDDLLPNRVNAASVFLTEISERDAEHLALFLDSLQEGVRGRVDAAQNAADVAEAVIQAAEDLHGYLLAHDIVQAPYRHLTAGSLFRRTVNPPSVSSRECWQAHVAAGAGSAEPDASADSHEYALAA
jgi:hypothetical protein